MLCNFSLENCNPECKKFSLCSLQFQQEKILEIQNQISALYETISLLANKLEENENQQNDKLDSYTAELLTLINKGDSHAY